MNVFLWLRFLMMLQLTVTFGPMLRIIIAMIGEVVKFLIIWLLVLFTLASCISLLFGSLDAYSDFYSALVIMFGTGLAEYDLSVFDDLPSEKAKLVGKSFITGSLIINSVVLLNFVIAILADTYGKLSS